MATAAAPASAVERPKKKALLLIGIIVLVFAAGGATAWFFLLKPKSDRPVEPAKKATEFVTIEPFFTVNLTGEDQDRYLQVGVVFEVSSAKASDQLKAKMPAIRSGVLYLMSEKKTKELLTLEGKKQLAAQILAIAREHLDVAPPENDLEAVHFSIFVIQ